MLLGVLAQEVCIAVSSQSVIEDIMFNRAECILDTVEPHHRGKTSGVTSFHENALRCNGLLPPSTLHSPEGKVRSTLTVLARRVEMTIEPLGEGTEGMHSSHIATDVGLVEMRRSFLVDIETLTGIHQGRNTPMKPNQGEHLNDPTRNLSGALIPPVVAKSERESGNDLVRMGGESPQLSRHFPVGHTLPELRGSSQLPNLLQVSTSIAHSFSPEGAVRSEITFGKVRGVSGRSRKPPSFATGSGHLPQELFTAGGGSQRHATPLPMSTLRSAGDRPRSSPRLGERTTSPSLKNLKSAALDPSLADSTRSLSDHLAESQQKRNDMPSPEERGESRGGTAAHAKPDHPPVLKESLTSLAKHSGLGIDATRSGKHLFCSSRHVT